MAGCKPGRVLTGNQVLISDFQPPELNVCCFNHPHVDKGGVACRMRASCKDVHALIPGTWECDLR